MAEVVAFFFFQAEDGIRDYKVTGVQTCALPIYPEGAAELAADALGLGPRGVRPEHDAVAVVGILGLQHARRESRAGELLRHLRRPGLVLRCRHLHVHRSLGPRRIGRRALIGLPARISEPPAIRSTGPPLREHPQVRAASLPAS